VTYSYQAKTYEHLCDTDKEISHQSFIQWSQVVSEIWGVFHILMVSLICILGYIIYSELHDLEAQQHYKFF